MSLDILGTLELAETVLTGPSPGQTVSEIVGLYKLATSGKPNFAAMDKAETLEASVASLARVSALLDKLLKDPAQRPHVVALLASF